MHMLTLTVLIGALLASVSLLSQGIAALNLDQASQPHRSTSMTELLQSYLAYRGSGRRTVAA